MNDLNSHYATKTLCVKCLNNVHVTSHHVYPKRFFPNSSLVIYLCRECHNEIEVILPKKRKLERIEYLKILKAFLRDEKILVIDNIVSL